MISGEDGAPIFRALYTKSVSSKEDVGSRNQGMEVRMVSFTTTPNNPLGEFVLFISAMLDSVNIETFSLK